MKYLLLILLILSTFNLMAAESGAPIRTDPPKALRCDDATAEKTGVWRAGAPHITGYAGDGYSVTSTIGSEMICYFPELDPEAGGAYHKRKQYVIGHSWTPGGNRSKQIRVYVYPTKYDKVLQRNVRHPSYIMYTINQEATPSAQTDGWHIEFVAFNPYMIVLKFSGIDFETGEPLDENINPNYQTHMVGDDIIACSDTTAYISTGDLATLCGGLEIK